MKIFIVFKISPKSTDNALFILCFQGVTPALSVDHETIIHDPNCRPGITNTSNFSHWGSPFEIKIYLARVIAIITTDPILIFLKTV